VTRGCSPIMMWGVRRCVRAHRYPCLPSRGCFCRVAEGVPVPRVTLVAIADASTELYRVEMDEVYVTGYELVSEGTTINERIKVSAGMLLLDVGASRCGCTSQVPQTGRTRHQPSVVACQGRAVVCLSMCITSPTQALCVADGPSAALQGSRSQRAAHVSGPAIYPAAFAMALNSPSHETASSPPFALDSTPQLNFAKIKWTYTKQVSGRSVTTFGDWDLSANTPKTPRRV